MSLLIFIIVLVALVLVHEFGHFIVAKWTGMRVDEFGIGFPPRLFGVRKGETLYSVNALPIGGFVKIHGEDLNASREEADFARSFIAKSKKAQAAVLLAGVFMNVLFAWFLFTIAFSNGVLTAVNENEAGSDAQLLVSQVIENSPASEAGLHSGIRIQKLTSKTETLETLTPSAFVGFVQAHSEEPLTLTYREGDTEKTSTLSPRTGITESDGERPLLGVALTLVDVVKRPFLESVGDAFLFTIKGFSQIAHGIVALIYDAFTFHADLSQVAGPVGMVGLVGEASAFGITSLLMFTAFISLNLAVINLLPFPALDGGRLLFVIIEAVKGTPINPKYASILNMAGFVILLILMLAVTGHDIAKLLS